MKNYLKIFVFVGMTIFGGALTPSFAQTKIEMKAPQQRERREFGRMPPFGFAAGGLNPREVDGLSLSDEQRVGIRRLRENERSASAVYLEKLQVIQEKIKDTTEIENFDESEARKLLKTRHEIQTEIEIIRLKTDSAIFNLLTAQ